MGSLRDRIIARGAVLFLPGGRPAADWSRA